MSDYGVATGHVQFDPKHGRQVNGQSVTDITIKAGNIRDPQTGQQVLVGITLWPEFAEIAQRVKKGDFISADGQVKVEVGQDQQGAPRTYYNLSPVAVYLGSSVVKPPRQVVQAPQQGFVQQVQPQAVQPVAVQPQFVQPVAAPAASQGIPAPQAVPTGAPAPF